MLMGWSISVLFSQTKINDVDLHAIKNQVYIGIEHKAKDVQQKKKFAIIPDLHAFLSPWGSCLAWYLDAEMILNEQIQLDWSDGNTIITKN